ncbi:MAG: desulfoferrodoxin family protein [Desulfuromonadaceae bacterium]
MKPGEKAEAIFPLAGKQVTAREYCNLHGLWSAKA